MLTRRSSDEGHALAIELPDNVLGTLTGPRPAVGRAEPCCKTLRESCTLAESGVVAGMNEN